jgi:hypothetical protein
MVLNTTDHSIELRIRLFLIRKDKNIAREQNAKSSVKINHLGTMLIVLKRLSVFAGVVILGRYLIHGDINKSKLGFNPF